jgi:PAS domain S-box-containing protein
MRSQSTSVPTKLRVESLYVDLPHLGEGSFGSYGLAVAVVAFATVLRVALAPWLVGVQFITLFPSVIITAFLCGMRAGFFAVFLATVAAWYFILPLPFSRDPQETAETFALAFFVTIASLDVVLIGAMRAAIVRVRGFNTTLAAVFEANPDGVFVTDRDGRIVRVNARGAALFGYAQEGMARQSIETLIPERYRGRHFTHRRDFFGAPRIRGMGAGRELFGRRQDGSEFPVDVQIGPLGLTSDPLVIATVRDMTQHRVLAEALAESRRNQAILEERQRGAEALRPWADAFEHAAFGIVIGDAKANTINIVNRAFATMRNMTVDQVQGMLITDLYPVDERHRVSRMIDMADERGHVAFESRQLRKDGTTFPVQVHCTSVRSPGGTIDYRIASVLDVTERARTEEMLRHVQKMEAIGNVTGGMAHDFNNLLGIIIGNLDLAAAAMAEHGQVAELIGDALEAALSGAELTRRLLAFARRQPLRPVGLQPNDLVSGMVRLLTRVLGEHIEVSLDLAADLWTVVVDPAQLEASLANLATNARDAMPKGGTLRIVTANRRLEADYAPPEAEVAPGDYVMIEVTDNGSGMEPNVLKRVFEPFFTTKEVGKGTGLGLSMVFGFAKQSGGHVSVYSEAGLGTTFRLFLPRGTVDATAKNAIPIQPAQAEGETILVVEDNDGLRRVALRQLSALGYRVKEAGNAKAALATLEAGPVDLLFSDVVMPGGIDGFELAREVLERWPGIRVLLTSGFPGGKVNNEFGPLPQAVRLLDKPYRAAALAEAVRDALDS